MKNVSVDRDEKTCLDAMFELKAVIKAHDEHKQVIQINLTATGVKIMDDNSKVRMA